MRYVLALLLCCIAWTGPVSRPMTKLSRHIGLDVGVDNLPCDRVHALECEVLVGAGRDKLKPRGLSRNHIGQKLGSDKVNNRT
jgi:hypothetical protein